MLSVNHSCIGCRLLLFLVGAAAVPFPAFARQDGLPQRTDTLQVTGTGPFLIRPFIQPESERLWAGGRYLESEEYRMDYRDGTVTFLQVRPDSAFSFIARYRHVPLDFAGQVGLWPVRASTEEGRTRNPVTTIRRPASLVHSGSITRGVLAGNNRDAAIESGLRLQLEGEIVPGVQVRASLTDEDTPIMPEGTTQRLDQFDRIYIELSSAYGIANLGDIETRLTGSRFARLDRRLQGAMVRSSFADQSLGPVKHTSATLAAATARGTFRTQELEAVDGIQGPYQLRGEEGERFILVLPGSEQVYLDGNLMIRGAGEDYTIDYTTGEITFSNRRIIGSERRIRVDFEYTSHQFTRTFMLADAEVQLGSTGSEHLFRLGVSAIREADGDLFAAEFGFTGEDSVAVRLAGDSSVFRSGATKVEYDEQALYTQYFQETRTGEGEIEVQVYVPVDRVPLPGEEVFRVTFSLLGPGQGSYRRRGTAANGIVYEYAGQGKGQYEPVRPLRAPLRKELVDVRMQSGAIPGLTFSGEWAGSRFDRNTLSDIGDDDDEGQALAIQVRSVEIGLPWDLGSLSGGYSVRRRSPNFVTFDRVRTVEFAREWNLTTRDLSATTNIIPGSHEMHQEADIRLFKSDSTRANLSFGSLDLGDAFRAERLVIDGSVSASGLPYLSFSRDEVASRDTSFAGDSRWLKQRARISRRDPSLRFQPFMEVENEDVDPGVSGVTASSSAVDFTEIRAGASHTIQQGTMNWVVERRKERLVGREPVIWTMQSRAEFPGSGRFHAEAGVGWRRSEALSTLLLDFDGGWRFRDRHTLSWQYDVQSERSAALQEIYIRTGPERGEYVWVDFNGDSIATLDEFIPETIPGEGDYVRTLFPSDSLETVATVSARIRLERRPGSRREGGGLGGWLRSIGSVTQMEVTERSRNPDRKGLYLLDLGSFRNEVHTLNGRLRVSQDLSLLPRSDRSDLNVRFQDVRTLSDLAAGLERSANRLARVDARKTFDERLSLTAMVERGLHRTRSASFSSRSFDIRSWSAEPGASYGLSEAWTVSASVHAASKRDRIRNQDAQILRVPLEVEYAAGGRMRSSARIEWSDVRLDGGTGGLTGFEMTDGRGAGRSWLWRYSLQSRLSEVLTASLSYDGRRPAVGPVIHTGRFQLSARF